MNLTVALIDLLTGCAFLTAAIVSIATSRLTVRRTRLWVYVTPAYFLFFVERVLNTLEWGFGDRFSMVDVIEDYFAVAACLLLMIAAVRFLKLVHALPSAEGRSSGTD